MSGGIDGKQIEITWSPGPKPGAVQLVAKLPDGATVTDAFNVVNSGARDKFIDRLCQGRDGIDRNGVAAVLEKIAATVASQFSASRDESAGRKNRQQLLAQADEQTASVLDAMSDDVREEADATLRHPRLIDLILEDIAAMGVVGEQSLALATYAVATSRLLPKPLAATIQALTSTGKSYVPSRVGLLIPDEAKLIATDITTNALYYLPEGALMHKFVLAGERRRGADDVHAEATRALREMLEAGELNKVVPVRDSNGKFRSTVLCQPGPIAYIDSTTNLALFEEDANRSLLLSTDESPEQTARIVAAQAGAAVLPRPDLNGQVEKHHAIQRLLKRVDVRIPYAPAIADRIPTGHQNARRAMPHILSMIRAIALLHQRQRADGTLMHGDVIEATVDDYVIARRLLLAPLGRALGGTLSNASTQFAKRLRASFGSDVFSSTDALQGDPVLDSKGKVNEYLNTLSSAGIVECVEASRGQKPARWKVVGEVPEAGGEWLPLVSALGDFA